MKKVLVVLPVKEEERGIIESAGAGCSFEYSTIKTVTKEQVHSANIIIGNAPPELIAASENLEFIQLNSAGAEPYVAPGVLHKNTILANAAGVYNDSVSEYILASILMMQKKLYLYRDNQNKHKWTDLGQVSSLSKCVILIVGLGEIGRSFAKMAKAFGAYIIGVKRRVSECPVFVDELYSEEMVDSLLPRADIIVSILPSTKETTNFFTEKRFKLMKKNAMFVNSGRGNAIQNEVLYKVLLEEYISSAAIDVAEIEPLPEDSPLWQLPNLCITPHIFGVYHRPEIIEKTVKVATHNLSAHLKGSGYKNVIDLGNRI